jgi:hypothetical protein
MRLRQAKKIILKYHSKRAAANWRAFFRDPSIQFREIANVKMIAAYARIERRREWTPRNTLAETLKK